MAASISPDRVNRMAPPSRPKRVGELSLVRDGLAALLAHDLKTPLAAISMNLDFVLAELPADAMPAAMRAALDDCRAANARAIRILSDMADAVRLQSGERRTSIADVDVQALLTSVVRRAAPEAAARGVRLLWSADAEVVRADEDLLGRAIERLLERALRHARVGGTIELTLRDGTIAIRVRSSGSDDARATAPESAIRGLAMHFADAAMRAQGGAVWTEEDADGALLFCVGLPPTLDSVASP
ncbi:MAG TPA: histidine kinase dimerization/phospho-acceptor domain-containing protein [Polyangiaceae bacterium]|nr:histidine kinase dimerization/phospho-acceptor domain-containing protein [Polyangiaceae bacterium]